MRLLVPPLIAYLAWNIWVVTRSIRRWSSGALGDSSFLASLGVLSLVRLPWLLSLADDWWWHHRRRLMVLVVVSIVIAVVALGTAIGLSRGRSPGVDVESRSNDRVDPIGSPRT